VTSRTSADTPFWHKLALGEMSQAQWESLCDGCGRCCLMKYIEGQEDRIFYTSVACRLLDPESCRCGDYEHRKERVADCVTLTPETIAAASWLPNSCAYRTLYRGEDLDWWHPLVSGSPETVHEAGMSVRHRVLSEDEIEGDEYDDFIVDWETGDGETED
jgi:uncharacterized cysteine cluster protein YcgN (CxxCxxCC family)